jgi:hypothetical protein
MKEQLPAHKDFDTDNTALNVSDSVEVAPRSPRSLPAECEHEAKGAMTYLKPKVFQFFTEKSLKIVILSCSSAYIRKCVSECMALLIIDLQCSKLIHIVGPEQS